MNANVTYRFERANTSPAAAANLSGDAPKIFFDITDIVEHAKHNRHVTGIQRVQWNVIACLAQSDVGSRIRCIFWDKRKESMIEPESTLALFSSCNDSEEFLAKLGLIKFPLPGITNLSLKSYLRRFSKSKWLRAYKKIELYIFAALRPEKIRELGLQISDESLKHIPPLRLDRISSISPADHYVILGASWHFPAVVRFAGAHSRRGGDSVQLVHDIIPVTRPEYFEPELSDSFSRWLTVIATSVTRFMCVSDWTRRDLQRFLNQRSLTCEAITVPLAHEFIGDTAVRGEDVHHVHSLAGDCFVLCVGTIEVRKNGIGLLKAWQILSRQLGDKTPRLVFAGKKGWLIEDFLRTLKEDPLLNHSVAIIESPSDEVLACLYQRCLFTVYPSRYEGWGLPVGESVWFGKFCIASSATSIPEVCGNLLDYVDPDKPEELARAVKTLLENRHSLADKERRLRKIRIRRWQDVAGDIYLNVTRSSDLASSK